MQYVSAPRILDTCVLPWDPLRVTSDVRTTIRLQSDLWEFLISEQDRFEMESDRRPTQAELLRLMRDAYLSIQSKKNAAQPNPRAVTQPPLLELHCIAGRCESDCARAAKMGGCEGCKNFRKA